MMERLGHVIFASALVLAIGCGSSQTPPAGGGAEGAGSGSATEPGDDRMAMWKDRQDAACQVVGERITQCSVEDARATMSEAELADLDLENTAPRHTAEFVGKCRSARMSPRQVRVYEVCPAEESECAPFLACLDNANASR